MNKRQAKKLEKKRAQELNQYLKHASNLRKGSDEIASQLSPLMEKLYKKATGKELPEDFKWDNKYNTKYFEISKDFTGKDYELFKYVTFKTLPKDKDLEKNIVRIAHDPYSTPKAYKQHKEEWAHKTYVALTTGITQKDKKIKHSNMLKYTSTAYASDIEYIMNSSAAWRVACTHGKDSDQDLADWYELMNIVSDAYDTNDQSLMDDVINAIEHGHSLDDIRDKVDKGIMDILAKEESTPVTHQKHRRAKTRK